MLFTFMVVKTPRLTARTHCHSAAVQPLARQGHSVGGVALHGRVCPRESTPPSLSSRKLLQNCK
jgi:hypothetical protein